LLGIEQRRVGDNYAATTPHCVLGRVEFGPDRRHTVGKVNAIIVVVDDGDLAGDLAGNC